jgi:hypothetical protein
MTVPLGDMPDWQTQVIPNIQAASIIDQQASITAAILDLTQAFRVWGVWVRMSVCTNASYVAAVLEIASLVRDGSSHNLIEVANHVVAANQINHAELAMPVPGFTPVQLGGHWQINLTTGASAANVFYRASAGILYSVP